MPRWLCEVLMIQITSLRNGLFGKLALGKYESVIGLESDYVKLD